MPRHSVEYCQRKAYSRKARLEMLPAPPATLATLSRNFTAAEPTLPHFSCDRGAHSPMAVPLRLYLLHLSPLQKAVVYPSVSVDALT